MIKSSLLMNISERLLPPYNNPRDVELSPLPPILPIIASHNYRSCTCQKPLHSVHTNTEIQNTQIHSHNIPETRVCQRTLHIVHTPAHFTLYISHISPFSAISYFNDSFKFWGWCPKKFPALHILKISTKQCRHIIQNKLYQNPISVECCSILHCLAEKWD